MVKKTSRIDSNKMLPQDPSRELQILPFWDSAKPLKEVSLEMDEEKAIPQENSNLSHLHPLLIDHVIEKIFSYASTGDSSYASTVRQFRLVCKLWCSIGTTQFRSSRGRICFENDFNRQTSRFIQVMGATTEETMLFDKFKFSGGFVVYKPYKGHYNYDQIFNALFTTCLPWMNSLEFSSHNPSDLKFPKPIRHRTDLGHLSSLSFHICVFYQNLQTEMAVYLGSLLESATNLKTLDIRLVSADPSLLPNSNPDQSLVMERFAEEVSSKIPTSTKHLKLNMPLNSVHFQALQDRKLQLECLIIDFQKISIDPRVVEGFLKSQSESLVNLEFIEAPFFSPSSSSEFPILPNLTHLKIEGKPRMPPNFRFDLSFPRLKSVEILFYWIYQDEGWLRHVLAEDMGHSKTVKELDFLCEINKTDLFILPRMVKTFPTLKRLSVVFNTAKALSTLFSSMAYANIPLENLEVSLSKEFWKYKDSSGGGGERRTGKVDEAFCGIPAELCVDLLRRDDFTNTDLPSTRMCDKASIRDLKHVKILKIRGYRAEQIPLSDVTVYYALLKMERLQRLILDVFPISKKCLRVLEERVNLKLLPGPPILS